MAALDPRQGLHRLKYEIDQWGRMDANCKRLLECFDESVRCTRCKAPVRRKDFKLDRESAGHPRGKEARWERAIWELWGPNFRTKAWFLPDVCHYIQTYQMPLRQVRADRYWQGIDLVGVGKGGLPVLIELKEPGSSNTPLFMMLEAVAYGLCIMKTWEAGPLRKAWQERVKVTSTTAKTGELRKIQLIGLAPEGYWQGFSSKKRELLAKADPALQQLQRKMERHGLIWHFATLPGAVER